MILIIANTTEITPHTPNTDKSDRPTFETRWSALCKETQIRCKQRLTYDWYVK